MAEKDQIETTNVSCKTCSQKLLLKRNQPPHKGFASAIAEANGIKIESKARYDMYYCPFGAELWHRQIIDLQSEIKRTASATLTTLLEKELDRIKQTRQATKTGYHDHYRHF